MIDFTDIETTDTPNAGRVVINDNFDLIQNTYPMGKALSLNGTTQYAYHADDDKFDVGTEDFAVSFMLKKSATGAYGRIIGK